MTEQSTEFPRFTRHLAFAGRKTRSSWCKSMCDLRGCKGRQRAEWSFTASSSVGFMASIRSSIAAGLSRLSAII